MELYTPMLNKVTKNLAQWVPILSNHRVQCKQNGKKALIDNHHGAVWAGGAKFQNKSETQTGACSLNRVNEMNGVNEVSGISRVRSWAPSDFPDSRFSGVPSTIFTVDPKKLKIILIVLKIQHFCFYFSYIWVSVDLNPDAIKIVNMISYFIVSLK